MGNFDVLAHTDLSSSQASIEFTSISSAYEHLVVEMKVRDDTTATRNGMSLQFNGDTGSNYNYSYWRLDGSGTSTTGNKAFSATSADFIGSVATDSSLNHADTFGTISLWIPFYSSTTGYKGWWGSSGMWGRSSNLIGSWLGESWGIWKSTAAINSIKLYSSGAGANFVSGTEITLYGISGP